MLRLPGQTPILTAEGVAALDEAIDVLVEIAAPLPLLTPYRGLAAAAAEHCADLARTGEASHFGSDGSAPAQRVERYGKWRVATAENISYGGESAFRIMAKLLIDDGVPDRGHRATMLDPEYACVGIAVASHPVYNTVAVFEFAAVFEDALAIAPPPSLLSDPTCLTPNAAPPDEGTGPPCAGCGERIVRTGTRALNKEWHPECLKCAVCGDVLNGDFFTKNGASSSMPILTHR
ncbi:allergen V5/Tpx-1 family protein [Thecamonas trahens ATCC 50062]|uniref:Allergen V5/Tpx-1 family protein n=1 Tax=Thecamonas trahens ATCC 50062 TaxID=461836 RepID=A0A0L0D698_THETB|nr:allergen V5/Tpx-1 family protein [Thecamonas trahens ATCC 50062]KNC47720.1 allergen V5/Tpx-1 family protein [Thecamonas trahens ATCC 50062]|eukprot:XP_013759202.1 allergen V5/Tpx-1 family protein [Thecamonas trahens ATCC 50062]